MNIEKLQLSDEELKEITFLRDYYDSMGVLLKVLNTEPRPLGTIKETLFQFGIHIDNISSIYVMSYDIDKTISYINKDHIDDKFKLYIYGPKNSYKNKEKFDEKRIKIIESDFLETEHLNLIVFTKELEIKYKNKSFNTKYLLFVEPYHDGDSFGPSYVEENIDNDYDKFLVELMKAKLYIPTENTVNNLKIKFNII